MRRASGKDAVVWHKNARANSMRAGLLAAGLLQIVSFGLCSVGGASSQVVHFTLTAMSLD
jgi:hypothetical protein